MGIKDELFDETVNYEFINHPKHYNLHPKNIECIDVVEDMSFNIGNAIKYLWRVGLKPGHDRLEELGKAMWYIEREILRIEDTEDVDETP